MLAILVYRFLLVFWCFSFFLSPFNVLSICSKRIMLVSYNEQVNILLVLSSERDFKECNSLNVS